MSSTPVAFDYVRPATIDDALAQLAGADPEVKILAGGHSLLPLLKTRLARPERVVDIGRLAELRGVRTSPDGALSIGALTTYTALLDDPSITAYGLLADVLPTIGDVQVRNRGTIGGSVAHVDPASDLPACLLALDAEVVIRSAGGGRTVPITDFFRGPFHSVLEPHELVTEIRLPVAPGSYGSAYRSVEQAASGYALAGAAVVVGRSSGGGGAFDRVAVGIAGVGDHPYRATATEDVFVRSGDPRAAAELATQGIKVAADMHADQEYRTALVKVQVRRAFEAAIERAG
jgi:carbon-monoxide dehydrogenase medium subunit